MILERADAMRRLAEAIQRHAAGFLERRGIDFEIRWHGVLRTLEGEGPASVVELARKLGITHPAVHHTVQSLVAEGLVASYRDARDKRRRVLALTRFGRMRLAELADVFRDLDAECRQRFEADLEGIRMLSEAGISPHGAVSFFEKMKEDEGPLESSGLMDWIGTHPDHGERIEDLKQSIATLPRRGFVPLELPWEEIRKRAQRGHMPSDENAEGRPEPKSTD